MSDEVSDQLYAGGLDRLVERFQHKRTPFCDVDQILPGRDVDLGALRQQTVEASDQVPDKLERESLHDKSLDLKEN